MIDKKYLKVFVAFMILFIVCIYFMIWNAYHIGPLSESEVIACREEAIHFLKEQANHYKLYLAHDHIYEIAEKDGALYCIETLTWPYSYAYADGWCYVKDQRTEKKQKFKYEWDFSLCEALFEKYPSRILDMLRDKQYVFEGKKWRNFLYWPMYKGLYTKLDPFLYSIFGFDERPVLPEISLQITLKKSVKDHFASVVWNIQNDKERIDSKFEIRMSDENINSSFEAIIGPLEEYTICTDEEQIALYKKGMLPLNEAYMPTFT